MNEIFEQTDKLAELLRTSREYLELKQAADIAFAEPSNAALLNDYRKLQMKVQAAQLSGGAEEDDLLRLQKLGELLQMNPQTSEYLFTQFRLHSLLGSVYKRLADAVDADLSMIDE